MLELNPEMQQDFSYRNADDDPLFQADYDHINGYKDCKNCDKERLIQQKPRTINIIHYGLIGSAIKL
jgi:hypothetical protein